MTPNAIILRLRDKFSELALRSAVELHTNYDKWNVEDLTEDELKNLFSLLCPQKSPAEQVFNLQMEQRLKNLRSIILKEASYIGLLESDNWDRFNAFMKKNSPLKKSLNQYKIDEFEGLIKQFKSMRAKYEKQAKIPFTQQWYHKNKIPAPSIN